MRTTDTIVIGAGQAGLAMSRCLTDRGVDHVVLERGRVAERWRTERWDSLRLLTPNWMSRLPGWSYTGPDPDGFMTAAEVVDLPRRLRRRSSAAPVVEDSAVRPRSSAAGDGFAVRPPTAVAGGRQRRHRHRLVRPARRAGIAPPPSTRASPRSRRPPTATRLAARRRRARRRRFGHRRRNWPTSWPRPGAHVVLAVGRPQPPAPQLPRHGHLLVARAHRQPATAPSTRSPTRPPPAASRRCSSSAGPTTRDARPATLRAAGVELAGRLIGVDGHRVRFAADLAAPWPTPTPGCAACSPPSTTTSTPPGWRPRCSTPSPAVPVAADQRARPARPAAARHHAPSSGRPATAAPTPGCTLPVLDAARRDPPTPRRHPASPASTSSGSASSTAAAPTSSTASAATPATSPTT